MYNYLIYFLNCINNLKVNSMLQFKKKYSFRENKIFLKIKIQNFLLIIIKLKIKNMTN